MSKKDLNTVRQVFRKAVEACHLPTRELERALGIGNGNLSRLLDGSLDLRIRHLLAFAELLEVPPHGLPRARLPRGPVQGHAAPRRP